MKKSVIVIFLGVVVIMMVLLICWVTEFTQLDTQEEGRTDTHQYINNTVNTKKAYVCITGQLSRLELHNKIQYLLNPLHALGYTLFIGLALSEEPPKYSNNNSGSKLILKKSIREVVRELYKVKGVKQVKHFPPNFDHLSFNPKYDKFLGNYTIRDENNILIHKNYLSNQAELAVNNARQFKTLQHCNNWPNLNLETEIIIRVREDVLIHTINLPHILRLVREGAIVTSKCDQWRGINDKIAFAPSVRSSEFFNIPYKEYLLFDNTKYKVEKLNAERLYKIAYLKHRFNLRNTKAIVATKAMTNAKGDDNTGKYHNCTVSGNPFRLDLSANCPRHGLDRLSYVAFCWK